MWHTKFVLTYNGKRECIRFNPYMIKLSINNGRGCFNLGAGLAKIPFRNSHSIEPVKSDRVKISKNTD